MPGKRKKPTLRTLHDKVVDREPDRSRQREPGAYHLHLQTIEWAGDRVRRICERAEQELRAQGREDAANTVDWLHKKIHGTFLREHETQRKALNRATQRDRERIEIEMKHTKQRANKLNALLDQMRDTQRKMDEMHGRVRGRLHETGQPMVPADLLPEDEK